MYKVSILVPIYKAEKCLERCVRSLFEQTYSDLEFVFVDDCSPDDSIAVLEKVVREYPARKDQMRLLRNNSNCGVAATRNLAIESARGEFICFVDADDWLQLNAIELLVERQLSENADIVYGSALMHATYGVPELRERAYEDKHDMMLCYSRFTPGYTMVLWRRLIRRSLFSRYDIKGIEGLNYAEDKLILVQLCYFSNVVSRLDSIVYHYNRMNEDSLVATALHTGFPLSVHRQEIGNMLAVVEFFHDKDEEYYSESSRALLRFINACMKEALSVSSRKGFLAMESSVYQIDSRYWNEIGWDSWKRVLFGNYYYMKFYPKVKRIVKRLLG